MTARDGRPRPIRVVVVEDSRFMRSVIGGILASDPHIEVVGSAADGVEALDAVAALGPDVVTMDVDMPRADGLAAVERIMSERPTPIVMISAHTRHGSAAAIRALELGAVDVVAKPSAGVDLGLGALRDEIVRKVRVAARIRPVRTAGVRVVGGRDAGASDPRGRGWTPCVVIAASTGGPAALLAIVPALPAALRASVIVVQHMPAAYTSALARELAGRSAVDVKEPRDGEPLTPSTVYVCPGGRHATVDAGGRLSLRPADPADGECPSADLAMTTVACYARAASVGVVLTGMGRDGAVGARAIRDAGGLVLAQDEASSVVFGMPRAAIERGGVDAVVPLADLPTTLCAFVDEVAASGTGVARGA